MRSRLQLIVITGGLAAAAAAGRPTHGQTGAQDVILLAANARVAGAWRIVSDPGAAAGRAAVLPDTGRVKVLSPVADPADYFTLSFDAVAGTPYHLWVRGRADGNGSTNDSVHVQFSEASDGSGAPVWGNWAEINLEDCSGCGNSGWGWEDNGWGSVGALGRHIEFSTSGRKTLRVQNREDGFFIDQIVLSPSTYLTSAPGANKNDSTILAGDTPSTSPEIVMHTASAVLTGAWRLVSDAAAASGRAAVLPNAGRAKVRTALANPADYFELTFEVVANTPYRLWVRGRADGNAAANDSVHVQFTNSVDASGAARWRIGTTSSAEVNLEDCSGCGNSGWGWEDNGWGSTGAPGPEIRFATTGTQRLRVQNREDGFFIDQIVLSPAAYLQKAPGANKNDTTILAPTIAPPPSTDVTLVRLPYLQQVTDRSAIVVWASQESGAGSVRINGRTFAAETRLVPASATGMAGDYHQHEALVSGLAPATSYAYEAWVGSVRAAGASLRTAPAPGTGSVRFIAFGDSGTGSTQQRTLASRMASDTWDLALHTGDLAYGQSSGVGDATYATYHAWMFDVYRGWLPRRPFFPSMGNHDGRATNGYGRAYLDLFVLPDEGGAGAYPDHAERYYSFDYGPVHFAMLDTERAFQDPTRRQAQLQWIERDLGSTSQPWKVAVFHRSPYSSGTEHGSDLVVRQAFGPLFERFGVHLVLSAHDHAYERSVPWREGSSGQGVTYVVTGGGGGPLYAVGTSPWTVRSTRAHHYTRVNISGCTLYLEAIGLDGVRFDRFTLDRCVQASDAGSPSVRIVSPSNGATVSGTVPVNIAASDDTRVEKVDLYVDGRLVGYDRTSSYAVSWNSRSVPAGSHVLEARAYDLAGNRVTSSRVTVTSTGS